MKSSIPPALQPAFAFLHHFFSNLPSIGPSLTPALFERSALFLQLLLKWNQTIRLTGAKDLQELGDRHLADSLIAAPLVLSLPSGSCLLDVGSGGGFPAIPLALLRDDLRWFLTESDQRRSAFLHAVKHSLHLSHVEIKNLRLSSNLPKGSFPHSFDAVTFRAVLPEEILPLLPPLLSPHAEIWYWGLQEWSPPLALHFQTPPPIDYTLPHKDLSFRLFRLLPSLPPSSLQTPSPP